MSRERSTVDKAMLYAAVQYLVIIEATVSSRPGSTRCIYCASPLIMAKSIATYGDMAASCLE